LLPKPKQRGVRFGVIRVILTVCRPLPVYPDKRTLSRPVGTSQQCQTRKCPSSLDHLVGARRKVWGYRHPVPLRFALMTPPAHLSDRPIAGSCPPKDRASRRSACRSLPNPQTSTSPLPGCSDRAPSAPDCPQGLRLAFPLQRPALPARCSFLRRVPTTPRQASLS